MARLVKWRADATRKSVKGVETTVFKVNGRKIATDLEIVGAVERGKTIAEFVKPELEVNGLENAYPKLQRLIKEHIGGSTLSLSRKNKANKAVATMAAKGIEFGRKGSKKQASAPAPKETTKLQRATKPEKHVCQCAPKQASMLERLVDLKDHLKKVLKKDKSSFGTEETLAKVIKFKKEFNATNEAIKVLTGIDVEKLETEFLNADDRRSVLVLHGDNVGEHINILAKASVKKAIPREVVVSYDDTSPTILTIAANLANHIKIKSKVKTAKEAKEEMLRSIASLGKKVIDVDAIAKEDSIVTTFKFI